ncbi:DUF4167 domain-containing protein [Novosphingobium sp. KCTC 2891]|uniref:DUF4167 domain-containing protein n=1 Tax=Novosphingobium sp. KCTC 2891 TaxID=2989730 RepID=UPI0039B41CD4
MNNNRGNNRRRGRGNSRPQGSGQQLNRIDSRARGNAPQLLEKYRKLAQDAHLNGDRVQAEYYLQFADHYFRVIADTRVRQEEQRQRAPGERWQEPESDDDTLEFGMDVDFPGFDRPQSRRDEGRREEAPREEGRRDDNRQDNRREDNRRDDNRRDEGRREEGRRDDNRREDGRREDNRRDENRRPDREPREKREHRPRFNEQREAPAEQQTLPGEGIRADEGEPIADANDNPFIRDVPSTRGLKPRTRTRRADAAGDAPSAPGLDPSSLPPAFGARADAVSEGGEASPVPVDAGDEAPAPKRRGRPRKNPPAEAAPAEG